jgi:hypothetical protein
MPIWLWPLIDLVVAVDRFGLWPWIDLVCGRGSIWLWPWIDLLAGQVGVPHHQRGPAQNFAGALLPELDIGFVVGRGGHKR